MSENNKASSNGKTEFQREADMQLAIENIDATQNALDGLNDQASEEILKIESKYNQQRAPLYEKRAKILSTIPNFWQHVLTSHPQIVSSISEEEDQCLQYLTNLHVYENQDIKSGYKLQFTFDSAKNPYFTNETIEKVITINPGGKITSTCTKIQWKQGKELVSSSGDKKKLEDGSETDEAGSFFAWLVNWPVNSVSYDGSNPTAMEDMMDIGDVIKEDIWPNPLTFYMANDEDDDILDEDEDGEGDEDDEDFDDEDDAEGEPATGTG